MGQSTNPASTHTDSELNTLLGMFGSPSYVRRGQRIEELRRTILERCRGQRARMGSMVRLRIRQLLATAGAADRLAAALAGPEEIEQLRALWESVAAGEAMPATWAGSGKPRPLRRALDALSASIERFNRRWMVFVHEVDLREWNSLASDYNRYYVLEKECALRSPVLARRGYRPLAPLRPEDLLAEFPLLVPPRIHDA